MQEDIAALQNEHEALIEDMNAKIVSLEEQIQALQDLEHEKNQLESSQVSTPSIFCHFNSSLCSVLKCILLLEMTGAKMLQGTLLQNACQKV